MIKQKKKKDMKRTFSQYTSKGDSTGRSIVKRQKKFTKIPRKISNELKWKDTVGSATSISSAWTAVQTLTMAAGAGKSTRIGDKIQLKSITCNFMAKTITSGLSACIRVVALRIMDDSTLASCYTTATPFALVELAKRDVVKVLFDEMITLDPITVGPSNAGRKVYRAFPRNIASIYAGDSSGNPTKNNIVFGFISDQVSNIPTISYEFRVRYYDA